MIVYITIVLLTVLFLVSYFRALSGPSNTMHEAPPVIVADVKEKSENLNRRHQQALKRKEKQLTERELLISHTERIQDVRDKSLGLRERELALTQEQNMMRLKKGLQDLYFRIEHFKLARREWNIRKAQDALELYRREVILIEKTAQSMFQIRSQQLQLLEQEFRVDHKERILEYKGIIQDAMNQIRQLDLKKVEIGQHASKLEMEYVQRELDRKISVIQAIEDGWYLYKNIPAIKAYNQSGYFLESPLIDENLRLKSTIEELQRRLPEADEQ